MSSLAAARADNFYFPPKWTPEAGSLNKFHGVPPGHLGVRAKKMHLGILVIRFEVPFDFWCEGCKNHVAKGVRYNAEKKSIGNYFTTKIWEFSMKCHRCSGKIVFKTDPKSDVCDYFITEGGKRKVETYEAESAESIEFISKEEREKRESDPMLSLEHKVEDKRTAEREKDRLEQLEEIQLRSRDDYSLSKIARKRFRTEKKSIAALDASSARDSLSFKLLPPSDADRDASNEQVYRNPMRSAQQTARLTRVSIANRPILGTMDAQRAHLQTLLETKVRHNIRSRVLASDANVPRAPIAHASAPLVSKKRSADGEGRASRPPSESDALGGGGGLSLIASYD